MRYSSTYLESYEPYDNAATPVDVESEDHDPSPPGGTAQNM